VPGSEEGGSKSEETGNEVKSTNLTKTAAGNDLARPSATPPQPPISHDDSWTLPYLSEHGAYIALHIDLDRSGYIRISEANTFTSTIPDGWTLPQWCAYKVAGIWSLSVNRIAFR